MAGDNCRCHSKPPLRVRKMAPSLPTAQPVFLSVANLTELIVLPCGSGFCHSQPEGCGCCAISEMESVNRRQAQLSKLAIIRRLKPWHANLTITVNRVMRRGILYKIFQTGRNAYSRGDVRFTEGRIIRIKPDESELCETRLRF